PVVDPAHPRLDGKEILGPQRRDRPAAARGPSLFPGSHPSLAGAAGSKEKKRERECCAQTPDAPHTKTREKSFAAAPCREKGFHQSFTSLFAVPLDPSGQRPVRGSAPGFYLRDPRLRTLCPWVKSSNLFRISFASNPFRSSGYKLAPLRPKRPGIFCIRLEEYFRFSHDLPHLEVEKETCTSRS